MSRRPTVLLATDLDRTLIYSRGALALPPGIAPELTCVEIHDGKQASFMTAAAAQLCAELATRATLVPVTTRIPEQLRRVRLPGPPPRYEVAANGGVLFVDGRPDARWDRSVAAALTRSAPLEEIWTHLSQVCRPQWTIKLRNAHNLFCYAVLDKARLPDGFVAEVSGWAAGRGWVTSLQGRKLYWVPTTLTKSSAVAEIAERTGARLTLAAGDSLLDIDLLLHADRAIHPGHGELAEQHWQAGNTVRTAESGVLAGERIVRWFADQLAL